jgi:hypothetical protein
MGIPYPSSPNTSELISEIVDRIQANCSYLDTTAKKFAVTTFTKDLDTSDLVSYDTITGIGFEPSLITFYAVGGVSGGSIYPIKVFGVYGINSDGHENRCINVSRTPYGRYYWKTSTFQCIVFDDSTNGVRALMYARVISTHSDGFVMRWQRNIGSGLFDYDAQIVATCFR